jgi:hypothetical protein
MYRRSVGRALSLLVALAALLMAGCYSPDLALVEGTVLADGKPLADIQVTFNPDSTQGTVGPSSSAVTDENGHYKLICNDRSRSPGAVVGKHRVTLSDVGAVSGKMKRLRGGDPASGEEENSRPGKKAGPSNLQPSKEGKNSTPSRIPAQYQDVNSTTLHKEVQPGPQAIDLEITLRKGSGTGGKQ